MTRRKKSNRVTIECSVAEAKAGFLPSNKYQTKWNVRDFLQACKEHETIDEVLDTLDVPQDGYGTLNTKGEHGRDIRPQVFEAFADDAIRFCETMVDMERLTDEQFTDCCTYVDSIPIPTIIKGDSKKAKKILAMQSALDALFV